LSRVKAELFGYEAVEWKMVQVFARCQQQVSPLGLKPSVEMTILNGQTRALEAQVISNRSYSVRLNSAVAIVIITAPMIIRYARSARMATKPASFSRIALKPCTA